MTDQSANADSSNDIQYNYVQEPEKDFARNEHGDRFNVGAAGRALFQRIHVRTPNGKLTTTRYDPEEDAPADNRTASILPTIVGLILAEEPDKYTKAGSEKRTIPTPSNLLRVVTPLTEHVSNVSGKYYVACHSLHGLCQLRLIKINTTFVYAEIWDTISETPPIKTRRTDLGRNVKRFAAKIQPLAPRAPLPISEGGAKCPGLTVTREKNNANLVLMQYSLCATTKSPEAYKALQRTIANQLPDILRRPSNEGTVAFYDYSQDLKEEEVAQLITEVKATYPNICPLDTDLILGLHDAMRKDGSGGDLPYQNLALFLKLSHDRAGPAWKEEILFRKDTLIQVTRQVLKTIKDVNETRYVPPVQASSRETTEREDSLPFLSALRQNLVEIKDFLEQQAVEMREQHGGIQDHSSWEDLMTKISNCVDRTALVSLQEQGFAIHAEQLATSNCHSAEFIRELVDCIDSFVASTPGSRAWGEK